eukprot:s510_g32.t1
MRSVRRATATTWPGDEVDIGTGHRSNRSPGGSVSVPRTSGLPAGHPFLSKKKVCQRSIASWKATERVSSACFGRDEAQRSGGSNMFQCSKLRTN